MRTRYDNSKCTNCNARIPAGTEVRYQNRQITGCPSCVPELMMGGAPPVKMRVQVKEIRISRGDWGVASVVNEGPLPADAPVRDGFPFGLTGSLVAVTAGDILDVQGVWTQTERYGWQFKCSMAVQAIASTARSLIGFLKKFEQIGTQRAEEILRVFGKDETLRILEHSPLRLAEIGGVTEERAAIIGVQFLETKDIHETLLFLADLQLGPSIETQIVETFAGGAKTWIMDDPYVLMTLEGVGFKTADSVAKKLNIAEDDPRRLAACVHDLMQQAEREGHTWSTVGQLFAYQK